ncbi:MAG: AzlD domain-containing protein [Roseibium album]|uniref:Putative membrane protein n=1 Tax=Roseibium album TaxID=311410 RepID=A0A0M6ZMC0_9HYPH|nr:AzlD domain-containing protein [Roseibium album]MBG6146279.1 putative membrane protein [Labrenzia sp. EL_142]MBG6154862.1 putative membrane protein [Labrenzia sp. EL_162]MBG6162120.1 putative membrane protein [Labrenzia sp. EL_195]MBG6174162.1 putative membrane protein [Labrenzia sp. EL_132]MBG6193008.1 putative membrane protein [Labrenzia sp. EL_159]MBG6199395.1 putative membrane protein [Labrenzia sp. EL_13]MBG6209478.1 putative membrane protein [Labrenzia sp. EL_126]MBG6228382.1 putat
MTEGAFTADTMVLFAILGMATVTYALRAGGYWVMGRVTVTPKIRRGLEALPGAIIVSTILPIILQGGLVVGLCIIVAAAVQLRLKKEYVAVFAAAAVAAALRAGGFQ